MGMEIWGYFVPYQPDIGKALSDLRWREFQAGRYNPVQPFPEFLPGPESPSPGAQHASIEEAVEASGADGTRSILDMNRIGKNPGDFGFGVVTPVSEEQLIEMFYTTQPTREMIESDMAFHGGLGGGQGVYVIVYRDGKPTEIFFTGLSYD